MLRFRRHATAPPAEKLAEQIAEACAAALLPAKIEPAKIEIDVFPASFRPRAIIAGRNIVAVEAILVVHLPFLCIRQNVVGFLYLFEFFFRGLVAGIEVGMVLPRQLPKRR